MEIGIGTEHFRNTVTSSSKIKDESCDPAVYILEKLACAYQETGTRLCRAKLLINNSKKTGNDQMSIIVECINYNTLIKWNKIAVNKFQNTKWMDPNAEPKMWLQNT